MTEQVEHDDDAPFCPHPDMWEAENTSNPGKQRCLLCGEPRPHDAGEDCWCRPKWLRSLTSAAEQLVHSDGTYSAERSDDDQPA